jgi:SAM-dependent methyltransferase
LNGSGPAASTPRFRRDCPSCAAQAEEPVERYSRDSWTMVRCTRCRQVYLNEAPHYETLSKDLAWTHQFAREAVRRKTKAPFIQWLLQKTRWRLHIRREDEWAYIAERVKAGNVLDVGCGPINRIPEQFTPFGIEIEEATAIVANEKMRVRGGWAVHAPALEGLRKFDDGYFNGVIMRSYLEHESHPREVLETCFRKLTPGGTIYVKVPNYGTLNRVLRGPEWCGFRYPDHLNLFTIPSMRRLAESVGYRFDLKNRITQFTNDNLHCFLTRP